MPTDIGRFVAGYLQVLAVIHIVECVVGLYWDACNFPLFALLLLWAASALQEHSSTARRWVIGFGMLFVIAGLTMMVVSWFGGNVHVNFFGFRYEDPSPLLVVAAMGYNVLIGAIPVVLLLTEQARREFSQADFRLRGLCPACGYDLRGSAGRDTCPECGGPITAPAAPLAR